MVITENLWRDGIFRYPVKLSPFTGGATGECQILSVVAGRFWESVDGLRFYRCAVKVFRFTACIGENIQNTPYFVCCWKLWFPISGVCGNI